MRFCLQGLFTCLVRCLQVMVLVYKSIVNVRCSHVVASVVVVYLLTSFVYTLFTSVVYLLTSFVYTLFTSVVYCLRPLFTCLHLLFIFVFRHTPVRHHNYTRGHILLLL